MFPTLLELLCVLRQYGQRSHAPTTSVEQFHRFAMHVCNAYKLAFALNRPYPNIPILLPCSFYVIIASMPKLQFM